ncbi:ABC transporter substrate-binding protein [Micromonospora sp. DT4]|uniref:ABC transporter substrate-binding protein n=1 Tax=Micromonospora sp. DT4 TaxID=3393438 RepID=UPI003CF615A3
MIEFKRAALIGGCLSLALALVSACSPGSAEDGQTHLAQIESKGVIRVGIGISPPYSLKDAPGNLTGFDPELLALLAADLGVKVEYVESSYTTIIAGLQAGKYDMVSSLQARPERQSAVDFVKPYTQNGAVFLVPQSRNDLNTLADFDKSNVVLACLQGGAQCLTAKRSVPNAKRREVASAGSGVPELVSEVVSGRSTALMVENVIVRAILQRYPEFKAVPDDGVGVDPVGVGWSVQKGGDPSLRNRLDEFITKRSEDGTIQKLIDKWFTPEHSL